MTVELILGDCLDVMRGMEAGSVDAVVTDPPYGLGTRWTGGTWFTRGAYASADMSWDAEPPQKAIDAILSMGVPSVIWGGNYFIVPPSRGWLVWYKTNSMPTMGDCELAWTNLDRPCKAYSRARNGWNREHPCEKPVDLMMWCIEYLHLPVGATICDFYMGSGSTGVAAVQLGYSFLGCEIDPTYYAIAQARIAAAQLQPRLEIPEGDAVQMVMGGTESA